VGDHVAMVPNRDTLLVTGSEDEAGLEEVLRLAEAALEAPRPLSSLLLRLQGNEWLPHLPARDQSLHDRFKLLWLRSLGEDYNEQKAALDRLHKKRDEDIFVASFTVVRHKDTGRAHSYCVWSEGVDSLLPRADLVMLYRPERAGEGPTTVPADWERACRVAGELMKPAGLYPERYRVMGFPSEEQLRAMGLDE